MNTEQLEALKTADVYMDNLKGGIINIAEAIQEGKEQEAINIIPQVVDGMQWIIDVIELTKSVQKEKIKLEEINEHIEEMIEAFENEDFSLVGDLFNYEILPILEEAHKQIKVCIA